MLRVLDRRPKREGRESDGSSTEEGGFREALLFVL